MKRGIGLALLALTDMAAQNKDPVEILMRLRDQVMAHAGRVPNHTCVESIQRDRFEPDGGRSANSCDTLLARRQQPDFPALLKLVSTDRLRLDVAFTGEREIYSWAGASRFEDGDIDELIKEGPMGTGAFASLIVAIFMGPSRFTFEGDRQTGGRGLMADSTTAKSVTWLKADRSPRARSARRWRWCFATARRTWSSRARFW